MRPRTPSPWCPPLSARSRQPETFAKREGTYVAATLHVADHLADGPQAAGVLAGLGILIETDGTFTLTTLGQLLRRDVPDSLHGLAVLYGDDWLWRAYGQMLHSAMTGHSAFAHVQGTPFYEYLDQNTGAASQFQHAMSTYSRLEAAAIAEAYDFAANSTVVDVGAGEGTLLAALLSAHPSLSGVLFDQPAVVARAAPVFTAAGVAPRDEARRAASHRRARRSDRQCAIRSKAL